MVHTFNGILLRSHIKEDEIFPLASLRTEFKVIMLNSESEQQLPNDLSHQWNINKTNELTNHNKTTLTCCAKYGVNQRGRVKKVRFNMTVSISGGC